MRARSYLGTKGAEKVWRRVRVGGRWARLACLLAALERAVEGAGRLDAWDRDDGEEHARRPHRGRPKTRHLQFLQGFELQMSALEAKVDHEVDRATAELLMAQLGARQARDRVRLVGEQVGEQVA